MFLSQVDDGTTYHVISLLEDRSEETVIKTLAEGWFRFFGLPDEVLLDAEGAFKGFGFETLMAQSGIKVRFVPADAHWQLGKCERHGQALKHILKRLIHQFAVIDKEDLVLVASLASDAKNSLARRSGASPAQWVYGRNPRVPASLLSDPDSLEAKQVISDSAKLSAIERMRHAAMIEYIDFEHSEALRKAILRKSRPWRGPLEVGQRVAYFRQKSQMDGEGSLEGYRQGLIIGLDPGPAGSVWIRNNRGRLIQVSREQVRGIEGEELWTPSSDDLKMLKSAEDDLAQQHAAGFQQVGPAPLALQDRSVLDALGNPELRHGEPLSYESLLPLVPRPAAIASEERSVQASPEPQQEPPRSNVESDEPQVPAITAEAPTASDARPRLPPLPRAEPDHAWLLDPNGRPMLTVDNADRFRTPEGKYDMNLYKYRSSWSYVDGSWQKLEDRVDMTSLENPRDAVPEGPVDRLVMTFSPSRARGQVPSIASARGVKRSASDVGLPLPEERRQAAEEPAEPPASSVQPPPTGVELDPAVAAPDNMTLLLYCQNCGCQQQVQNDNRDMNSCARCSTSTFVEDPRLVESWFDEIEEHDALQLLEGQVHYNPKMKMWQPYGHIAPNSFLLPKHEDLDNVFNNESMILDVGQAHRVLPEPHTVSPSSVWSVAVQPRDEPWSWLSVFDDIHVAGDTLAEEYPEGVKTLAIEHSEWQFPKKKGRFKPRRREQDWLLRHGRHGPQVPGWDGSPPELQPFFENDGIVQAYHVLVDRVAMDLEESGSTGLTEDPELIQDAREHAQLGRPSWEQQTWTTSTTTEALTAKPPTEMNQVITGPDSESEDEEAGEETSGRALRQALKRETPWKAISAEDAPGFIKAMIEEWDEWKKWSSCKPITYKLHEIPSHLILKSRVCYRWKPKDGGKWFKPKARIVVQGYQDPHLPLLSRDAPVLAKTTLVLIIQWAASFGVSLWNGDCKSAFLQGEPDTERPAKIHMRPPRDPIALAAVPEWQDPDLLYQLTAPVYGQANAPRRWFLHVLHTLQALLWIQHTLDPCCFLQKVEDKVVAVLGIHVDDVIVCALPGHEHLLRQVQEAFVWGSEWEKDSFMFVGRQINRLADGSYTIDQMHYTTDISKTRISHEPETKLHEHPELVTEFRSGIGSLQWMAGTTRGDLAADVSLLQRPPKELTVADLREVNRVLKYVKATANAFFKISPVNLDEAVFIAYGDSGWANAPGLKSQGGLVVTLTDRKVHEEARPASLLEWKSYRHQRMLRSTLAAEAASLDRAADMGNFLACVFSEMVYAEYKASSGAPMFEVIPVTDARSLWDAIHRLSTTFSEKRVEIDVAGLRQSCRGLKWVPTEKQWADAMTKRCPRLRDAFRRWAMEPLVTLREARSAEDGPDHLAWRGVQSKEKNTSDIVEN